MSFLKKGLLSNYITKYDSSLNPKFVNTSDGVKRAWTQKFYEQSCEFFFNNGSERAFFRFSLPPQSIEISYPQRVFETKTFGGSVIEDYGNDTVNITIQGTTANSDIRYYISGKTKGSEVQGSGINEINAFRDVLDSFGAIENLKNKSATMGYDKNFFHIYPKEFSVKQSKENPLSYSYTITLIGYVSSARFNTYMRAGFALTFKEKLNNIYKKFNDFVSKIEGYVSVLENGLQVFDDFLDIVATIRAATERLEKAVDNLVNQILAYVDAVSTCITETTKLGEQVVSTGIRIGLGTVDKAMDSAKELVEACDEAVKFFEDFTDTHGEMSSDILQRWEMTHDEIIETCKYMMVSSKEKAEELQAEIQETTSSCDAVVVPGDKNSDDTVVFAYGVKEYTLTSNDTWESLALKFYNDASKASLLSSFNNQKLYAQNGSSDAIGSMPAAGSTVYIPVLEISGGFDGTNEVYNQPDIVDNYGKDIEIDSTGDLSVHNGDFAETEGVETLLQGIINRLCTTLGTRLRDTVYGIKTNIGSTESGIQMAIASSIEDTLLADPRVKSVDSIEYSGSGDKLSVSVSFTDINDNQNTVGGTF